jgi:hypothetical protein
MAQTGHIQGLERPVDCMVGTREILDVPRVLSLVFLPQVLDSQGKVCRTDRFLRYFILQRNGEYILNTSPIRLNDIFNALRHFQLFYGGLFTFR